jgi:hypothetical protein
VSSDCFYVRVGAIDGKKAILHVLTGFAGGETDLFESRSFALQLLVDAKERAGDHSYLTVGLAAEERARVEKIAAAVAGARSALPSEYVSYDENSNARWVPQIVARATRLARRNTGKVTSTVAAAYDAAEAEGMGVLLDLAWRTRHQYDLEVEVTDPKYLAHLREGHLFATTAYDAWNG